MKIGIFRKFVACLLYICIKVINMCLRKVKSKYFTIYLTSKDCNQKRLEETLNSLSRFISDNNLEQFEKDICTRINSVYVYDSDDPFMFCFAPFKCVFIKDGDNDLGNPVVFLSTLKLSTTYIKLYESNPSNYPGLKKHRIAFDELMKFFRSFSVDTTELEKGFRELIRKYEYSLKNASQVR